MMLANLQVFQKMVLEGILSLPAKINIFLFSKTQQLTIKCLLYCATDVSKAVVISVLIVGKERKSLFSQLQVQ